MWVGGDFTYQAFLNAALILLGMGSTVASANNVYQRSRTQSGFATFGGPHVLDLVARVANPALKAAWCQKWLEHRRLRPEAFAGRVHNHVTRAAEYPLHPELLRSPSLNAVFQIRGTYLLPMAYPEGAPAHPSYPAGHAAIAGASATILKAFFREDAIIPDPVVASPDGLMLLPYDGPALTVGGELNKLAANIALARDTAGVHYRSDGVQGLRLGEAVAISVLEDLIETIPEKFEKFRVTKFDGTEIGIGGL